jgi:hypothetical protein
LLAALLSSQCVQSTIQIIREARHELKALVKRQN